MDKTIRKYTGFDEMKADEYRYWQSRPVQVKELLAAFNEHLVKYLIVGGYAVAIHAQPRATKDLDIFVQPDPKNAEAVYSALAKKS